MHVFVGNFTYVTDFVIVEDISSIIDPKLSQVVLGKPFVDIPNMTHDPPEGVVRFTNGTNEIANKMPHKIEQYNRLSDLEKEYKKSVYLKNEEDKRRGVEYVMSKILGFYKEYLELGPDYVTGMDDEGEIMVLTNGFKPRTGLSNPIDLFNALAFTYNQATNGYTDNDWNDNGDDDVDDGDGIGDNDGDDDGDDDANDGDGNGDDEDGNLDDDGDRNGDGEDDKNHLGAIRVLVLAKLV
nr:retrotransposon Orf1 [Tanacetum cinerariifolium]